MTEQSEVDRDFGAVKQAVDAYLDPESGHSMEDRTAVRSYFRGLLSYMESMLLYKKKVMQASGDPAAAGRLLDSLDAFTQGTADLEERAGACYLLRNHAAIWEQRLKDEVFATGDGGIGWERPIRAKLWHYFDGTPWSLCRAWEYPQVLGRLLGGNNPPRRARCKNCQKAYEKLEKREGSGS